jgi:hypothetical protein
MFTLDNKNYSAAFIVVDLDASSQDVDLDGAFAWIQLVEVTPLLD